MNASSTATHRGGDVLALGFGTTVAMWAVGYVCRFPPAFVPVPAVLVLMLLCALGGGVLAGRLTIRGWTGGLRVGIVSAVLNLLILGSVVGGHRPDEFSRAGMLWVPAILAAITVLATVGAAAGAGLRRASEPAVNWTSAFAGVAAAATLLLIAVGGVVTSTREGLAVPDWPNSFRYNMFLYPLSRMTGGVYFEHAHRLLGSLVGLTTLTLAVHVSRVDRRRWLRAFLVAAVVAVCVQGVLGGLRVTGRFTMSDAAHELSPSTALAAVHGVLGQVFFGMVVAVAVFTSTGWRSDRPPARAPAASTDRFLGVALTLLLIVQLVFGAIQRHFERGLLIHITLAAVVTLACVASGARAWGLYGSAPTLRRSGQALLVLIAVQVVLGILALVAVSFSPQDPQAPAAPLDVAVTTLHQVVGAVLLAFAVLLTLGTFRFLSPAPCDRNSGRA